jgi:formylglycine-generating enzyme required for sulfatase activity
VSLSAFAIGKYPVTVAQFCKFLNSRAYKPEDVINTKAIPNMVSASSNRFLSEPGYSSFPARNISAKAAEAFCQWVSELTKKPCRLPTEAEWEYVARGSEGRTYPWGEAIKYIKLTNKPVGSHPELATPEGVHDLNGPVYQWCADRYDEKYYLKSPVRDPVCTFGRSRVVRGGPKFRGYEEK